MLSPSPLVKHTGVVTADWLEMISTDTQVMHGQVVIAGTRVPVSAILDRLAAGMSAEEITAEYPAVTGHSRGRRLWRRASARATAPVASVTVTHDPR
jgi:uncharacterized protein (DUF433 family)